MNQTISVIVPVYNVEKYLSQCADSILSQDYSDLEVIFIDDGSTDASGQICDQYAEKDPRVRVIHQKNGGAAAAKNAGLRMASGKYLSFVDSDDYLEPNVYGGLVRTLLDTGADVVQGSFREIYRNRAEEQRVSEETLEGYEYLLRFPKDFSCALLWNKLYRRELFAGVFSSLVIASISSNVWSSVRPAVKLSSAVMITSLFMCTFLSSAISADLYNIYIYFVSVAFGMWR